jgi:energy-converting hydrogenase A subunit R
MRLFPNGDKVFEVISRYDDLLAMEGRQNYEPGDTLALIVPFLLLHNITEVDIEQLAEKATFINGAVKLISKLQKDGWQVFCITTTYEQYAHLLTQKLGIERDNVASTSFRLNSYTKLLCQDSTTLLRDTESSIVDIINNDSLIKERLDDFFWQKLPKTKIGRAIKEVKPIGGSRKVTALKRFAKLFKQPLAEWVVVGDSITDFRMLKEVNNAGGISIAFNANQYALPYATLSLASMDISDLEPILSVWKNNSRDEVKQVVSQKKTVNLKRKRVFFQWLADKDEIDEVISTHGKMRRLVREEAGKLG